MRIIPVILCGGAGTRLWPLSRSAFPKQLLPLVSENTMLQETLLRISDWVDVGAPVVICGNDHRFLVAEQLRQINITPAAIILEPVARNTAPAIAAAAMTLQLQDDLMLVLPADHVITDIAAFEAAVRSAAVCAAQGKLVTFGISPTTPETGYGYIQSGQALAGAQGCFEVARFVEKPNASTAQQYLETGDYFWNSGMFLFKPSVYLSELERFAPAIVSAVDTAVAKSYPDLDFLRLYEEAFSQSPSDSIDYAVMEKTRHAAVVPASVGWNDVGSWNALKDVQACDAEHNTRRGDVYLSQVHNTLVRAESRFVAALGVSDLLIVETSDAVLVAHRDYAQDVKSIVAHLESSGRTEHKLHPRVYRPWGWYEGMDAGERFQVKRIMVKPGEQLSLQMHHHRAEHWVIVSGSAKITIDGVTKLFTENESTYIPIGSTHRLENPGKLPLHLIEVQSGSYLGEDDIVRYEDTYGRA